MCATALEAHSGGMLSQYSTTVAADDRILRREQEAAAVRRPLGHRPGAHQPFRRALTALMAQAASRLHRGSHPRRPALGQEAHPACG